MSTSWENDLVIERALVVLADRLAPAGWRRRPIGRPATATFTRPVGNGVIATLDVRRRGITYPDTWPVTLRVVPGVGSEAALALWPLLGRAPHAAVTWDRATGGPNGTDVDLDGEPGIEEFVDRVVELVDGPAGAFAESFPDVDALVEDGRAGRARRRAAADTGDARGGLDGPSMADLLLVLATGRHDEARAVLDEVEAGYAADGGPGLDPRFARQVRRRLDAANTVVPPLEETMALLPRAETTPRSWSESREGAASRRAARDVVRARAAGRNREEVIDDLAGEYVARGLDVSRARLAVIAEDVVLARQPLGGLRSRARQALTVATGVRRVVDHGRDPGHQTPDWLRPPERASYPMGSPLTGARAAVLLDTGVEDVLERVLVAAPLRLPNGAGIDVWFTAQSAGADERPPVVAHIGAHRVGVVPADRAGGFPAVFRAAALFDEDPVVSAVRVRAGGTWYLDVPDPAVDA